MFVFVYVYPWLFCAAARTDSDAVGCYSDKRDDRVFSDKTTSESMTPSVSNARFDERFIIDRLCFAG